MKLGTKWKSVRVYWKQWNDGAVVFNALSGNTHLLTPTAADALKALEQQPATAIDLARQLAAQTQIESDQELTTQVEKLLTGLDELGLIEPVPE